MNRFFSSLASILFTLALAVGVIVPLQAVQAANACQFACLINPLPGVINCNTDKPRSTPCRAQCTTLCQSLGMSYPERPTPESVCSITGTLPGNCTTCSDARCSACSCVPTTAIACTGGASGVCPSQCTSVCSAARSRLRALRGFSTSESTAECAPAVAPQCVAVSQGAAVRLCSACMTRCASDTFRDPAARDRIPCYRSCGGTVGTSGGVATENTPDTVACSGVSTTEAGIPEGSPTAGGTPGGSSGGGSRGSSAGSGRQTGGGSPTSAPAPAREGTCNFTCQPQVPAQACTTNEECVTRCGMVCGRSFRNGQCVTTGPTAARCGEAVAGAARQCIFECTIGTSAEERSCNPQGTDDAAPARVCGNFCQTACRSASIGESVPSTAQFCGGSASVCAAAGGSTAPPPGGSDPGGSTAPGGAGGERGANRDGGTALGAGAGGSRLTNPLRGVDSIASLVGRLVKGILGIVGSLTLLMFVYGGVRWILSAGDPKDISAARNIIKNAAIGMVLIFFSYSISSVILGLLGEIGGGGRGSNSSSQTGGLATCVQYAVSRGHLGQNEARDLTTPDWACRQTQRAERTDRARCITRGCPTSGATVLCCAPAGEAAADSTPTGDTGAGDTAPAPSGTPAPTGGAGAGAASGATGGTAPVGCQVEVRNTFHLRGRDAIESSGTGFPIGTRVQVVQAGTSIRNGIRSYSVRVVVDGAVTSQQGWMFLTPAQITACVVPLR